MNILSSKAHIPAGVFSSSLSNVSEGKTFMKEIKECPCSAALLFSHMTGEVMAVCEVLAALHAENRGSQIPAIYTWEHWGVNGGCRFTSVTVWSEWGCRFTSVTALG